MDRAFVTDTLQEARAQSALARLERRRASDAAPVRSALSTTEEAALWHLGRTPGSRFDRVFLRDAQRGNDLALKLDARRGCRSDQAIFWQSADIVGQHRLIPASEWSRLVEELIDLRVRGCTPK
jgi:hypothetical protein